MLVDSPDRGASFIIKSSLFATGRTPLTESSGRTYILRLGTEEAERHLFVQRWLFVGLKRDWTKDSKILFVRKSEAFIGSGIVAQVQQLEDLENSEREICRQRNWSTKLLFETLARFSPPLSVKVTSVAPQSPMSLHGSVITHAAAAEIEGLASAKIIT